MKLQYVAIILAVVIVAGAGFLLFGNSNSSSEGDVMMKEGDSMMQKEEGAFSGNLMDLAKRGGNYKCTFAHEFDAAQSSGTVYVAGDKIRGDFTSEVVAANLTVESHMIQSGGYTYMWSPMTPNGFKAKTTTEGGSGSAAPSGQYADLTQEYAYNCSSWSVDQSMFELPSGIQFVEI